MRKVDYIAPMFTLVTFDVEEIAASTISIGEVDDDDRDAVIIW